MYGPVAVGSKLNHERGLIMSSNKNNKPTANVLPLPTKRKDQKPAPESKQSATVIPNPTESRFLCRRPWGVGTVDTDDLEED